MDPHELLHKTRAMTPAELVKFSREKIGSLEPLELLALTMALTTKLDRLIDEQVMAADQAMIDRARPLDGLAACNARQADPHDSPALERRLAELADEDDQTARLVLDFSRQVETTTDLADIHRKLDSFLADSELAERAAGFEVP
jgi:hypothetical protein